jgi:hypothetical protein
VRYKVDLSPDVVWFVRHQCNCEEQDAFFRALEIVRTQPVAWSEAASDAEVSPYMLRFFRFAANIALFEFDPGRSRIRVLECRRSRKPRPARGDTEHE